MPRGTVRHTVRLNTEDHAVPARRREDLAAYRALYDAGILDGAVMSSVPKAPTV